MSQPQEKPEQTVRLWKRLMMRLYLAFTAAIALWTLASLTAANFGGQPVSQKGWRIQASASEPKELRKCLKFLDRLLNDYQKESLTLHHNALKYKIDPRVEWRNWSQRWKTEWHKLEWRCRFNDLPGSGVSPAIDEMAEIHLALNQLQASTSTVITTYVEQHVERLRALRHKMTAIRTRIDRRDPANKPPRRSTTTGVKR